MGTPHDHPRHSRSHAGAKFTRIYSYGAARGDLVVPNEELIGPIDSSDEWIQQRTGIVTRTGIVPASSRSISHGCGDAKRSRSPVSRREIDLVIVATISNVQQTPSIAAVVADRVGANPAAAYDTNAACAGFSYAVTQADALIRSGAAHYALVIGAEKLSDVVDPTDRSISFLLGDGAGAVVIGPSEFPGIAAPVWGSDGSKAAAVGMNATLDRLPRRQCRVADTPPGGPDRLPLGRLGHGEGGEASARGGRHHGRRSRRLHSPPGEHAHHRRVREAAEAAGTRRRRPRHRHDRQHLRRLDPARHASTARRASGTQRRARPADRIRRRARLRSPGHRVCPKLDLGQNDTSRRKTMALSTEEVLAGLAELINDETGIATDTVELDKSFTDDLDIDSISMMTIVVNAEEKFDVKIPDDEVKNLKTVGDAVTFIVAAQG
jgi:acyl carrier protein